MHTADELVQSGDRLPAGFRCRAPHATARAASVSSSIAADDLIVSGLVLRRPQATMYLVGRDHLISSAVHFISGKLSVAADPAGPGGAAVSPSGDHCRLLLPSES